MAVRRHALFDRRDAVSSPPLTSHRAARSLAVRLLCHMHTVLCYSGEFHIRSPAVHPRMYTLALMLGVCVCVCVCVCVRVCACVARAQPQTMKEIAELKAEARKLSSMTGMTHLDLKEHAHVTYAQNDSD